MTGASLVTRPLVDLCRTPDGPRDRQLQMGEAVDVMERHAGWARVTARRDGYAGVVPEGALGAGRVTHRVCARATHVYPVANFKARERFTLGHGARLQLLADGERFAETPHGFVPRTHLAPVTARAGDPVSVAALYLGTPYLWGGDSAFGIDCSGLVQAACLACGLACPGDSGPQRAGLGTALPEEAVLQRGDLVFWRGHVAWVADPDTLLHANAHHMAVTYEPLSEAVARIAVQGEGPVIARKRLPEIPPA